MTNLLFIVEDVDPTCDETKHYYFTDQSTAEQALETVLTEFHRKEYTIERDSQSDYETDDRVYHRTIDLLNRKAHSDRCVSLFSITLGLRDFGEDDDEDSDDEEDDEE